MTTLPTRSILTFPSTMLAIEGSLLVNVKSSPALLVASRIKSGVPNVLLVVAANVIYCTFGLIFNTLLTSLAAL
ncbi:hypothetical protein D9M68_555050 [compost metagenome]